MTGNVMKLVWWKGYIRRISVRPSVYRLAENMKTKVGPGLVLRLLEEMTMRLGTALAEWTVSFTATVGKDPVIDRVRSHIRNQVRRTRNLMALV